VAGFCPFKNGIDFIGSVVIKVVVRYHALVQLTGQRKFFIFRFFRTQRFVFVFFWLYEGQCKIGLCRCSKTAQQEKQEEQAEFWYKNWLHAGVWSFFFYKLNTVKNILINGKIGNKFFFYPW
jgi:hypothetical protein